MMQLLESFFGIIGDLTWGWALVPFLVIFGLFFTIVTDFVQFRFFKRMFRVLLTKTRLQMKKLSLVVKHFYSLLVDV
ncbi:hypothetical protein P4S64_03535 [Vibrio sp. M60_M31a]